MGALRTLLRRRKDADQRPDGEGGTVTYVRPKPQSKNRRVLSERREGDYLISHHATKGYLKVKVRSAE